MKQIYARDFGLSVDQLRFFGELTEAQQAEVERLFNLINPGDYIYAVKRDGGLVWERKKRDLVREANTGDRPVAIMPII